MPIVRKANYVLLFGVINLFTYFLIQDCVTHKYNFLTDVDKAIPFMPEFVWIYHSLLPVIGVTMVLLVRSKKLFFNAMWACVATTLILHFFYVTFPSFYPRPLFVPQDLSEMLVQVSYDIDNSSNTFLLPPSRGRGGSCRARARMLPQLPTWRGHTSTRPRGFASRRASTATCDRPS